MNSTFSFVHKFAGTSSLLHIKEHVLGVIQDFWHDGEENPLASLFHRKSLPVHTTVTPASAFPSTSSAVKIEGIELATVSSNNFWHPAPGEIDEIMWGEGCLMPGDIEFSDKLITPMSLKSRMSVLDLSAGFGRRARQMVDELDVLVTGLESDPQIAVLGMAQSVEANKGRKASIANYDPNAFKLNKGYDAIIIRELLYRIELKEKFLRSLTISANKNAFVSFTDYVVDPEQMNASGIKAWLAHETEAKPIGLIHMGEVWAKAGFYLINQEDLTPLYKKEVLRGMKHLAVFLTKSKKLDAISKQAVKQELELWTHRVMAIESGMRLFRFLGTKHG